MASLRRDLVIVKLVVCLVTVIASSDDFNLHFDDLLSCKDKCDKYPFHFGGNPGDSWECCMRGCRFSSILSFLLQPTNGSDANSTAVSCATNCDEAYSRQADRQACHWGCQGDRQDSSDLMKEDFFQQEDDVVMSPMLYPLVYMHSVYSNMLFKVHHHLELRWSLFIQSDSGELVVLRSPPTPVLDMDPSETEDPEKGVLWVEQQTGTSLESILGGQDLSATPRLNLNPLPSQIRATSPLLDDPDSQGLQLEVDGNGAGTGVVDWWRCVVSKAEVTRLLLLCLLVLVCVTVMVWACVMTAAPVPQQQKLSIHGDLEYLQSMVYKDSVLLHLPQDRVQASPLPIKICVERV